MTNFLKTLLFITSLTWSQNLLPKVTTDTDGNINKVEYYRVIGNKIILVKKEEYYSNGQKKIEMNFKKKEKNGLLRGWDKLGKIEREEFYNDDLRNGLCVYWFSNGQKKEEAIFKNGKKNGLFSGWYRNGNKRCEINYKNVFKFIYEKGYDGILGMEHGNSMQGIKGEKALVDAYLKVDSF